MLDTVVIKVHDVKKHKNLATYLYSEKFVSKVYYRQIIPYNMNGYMSERYIRYSDTGKPFRLKTMGKLKIQSSHYNLAYDVVTDRDYIYFNFSIPKYLFGNNINQFVSSPYNKEFSLGYYSEFENQAKMIYDRFLSFINDFFEEQFPDIYIDFKLVEISRIDLCFNQIFNSKNEALHYLDQQKRILKKSERLKKGMNNYRTGIDYQTSDMYFKIYHKGTEYEIHDKKEHSKINSDYSREYSQVLEAKEHQKALAYHEKTGGQIAYFDTAYLQKFSDRILRYELSFSNKLLSRIYNTKILHKEVKTFEKKLKRFKELKRKSKDGQETEKLTPDELKEFKKLLKTTRKSRRFFVSINKKHWEELHYTGTKFEDAQIKHFSRRLMNECIKMFYSNIKRFTLKQLDDYETIMNRCRERNDHIDEMRDKVKRRNKLRGIKFSSVDMEKATGKKIQETKISMLLKMMEKDTLDEIKQKRMFSDRTLQRYRVDLKLLGVENNHIKKSFVEVKLDFHYHYNEILHNQNKLYINRYSKFKY